MYQASWFDQLMVKLTRLNQEGDAEREQKKSRDTLRDDTMVVWHFEEVVLSKEP